MASRGGYAQRDPPKSNKPLARATEPRVSDSSPQRCQRTLGEHLRAHHTAIDTSHVRLTCIEQGVTDIEPNLAVLQTAFLHRHPRCSLADLPSWLRNDYNLSLSQASVTSPSAINLSIAESLKTILLSRNRISSLRGLILFPNVVKLSLQANRIRTLVDCDPLTQLLHLQHLSLEFNPVCSLPHYRQHILVLCHALVTLDSVRVEAIEQAHRPQPSVREEESGPL